MASSGWVEFKLFFLLRFLSVVSIDMKKPKKSDSSAVSKEFIKKMEEWNHIKEQSKQDESSRDSDKKGKQTKGWSVSKLSRPSIPIKVPSIHIS